MEWLNYHHLLYFWMTAREGSVTKASEKLHLSQPTLSWQIRVLENALGKKLFVRSGRHLVLTDTGRLAYRYADDIFSLGGELLEAVKGGTTNRPIRFLVGVADVMPKIIAYEILKPALRMPEKLQIVCREDKPERLLAELAMQRLDVVLTDAPVPPFAKVRVFNHLLGECGVVILGTPGLSKRFKRGFPKSLNGAPFLMPGEATSLNRELEQWFSSQEIRPNVVGEFDDTSLLKVFGQEGLGLFAVPSVIQGLVCKQYGVTAIGAIDLVTERFYAVSVERKLRHPAVVTIMNAARRNLFTGK